MPHLTTRILREEHVVLGELLRTLLLVLNQHRERKTTPDFLALRAMLFYVDEYPEKRHHRTESELLFPKLRARSPVGRHLLDRLDEDHRLGEFRIRELEHSLSAYELLGESRRAAFEADAARYVAFYLEHMALEEREVFPLAQRVLTPEDWEVLDEAVAKHQDPLTGHAPEDEFTALFTRIVHLLPPPFGM